jgi:hypothetical protein
MIVVCIKQRREGGGLTIGKHYELVSIYDWNDVNQYVIVNDFGIEFSYRMSYFMPLQDWRDKQIEKLINE